MSWNFKSSIALPLEEYCNNYLDYGIWTAKEIEGGMFIHAMLAVLNARFFSLKNFEHFTALCNPYVAKPASKIPQEKAKEIFYKFEKIMKI